MLMRQLKLVLATVIVCFVLATAYISVLIVRRQAALEEVSQYNISWLASQAVAEFIRLQQRVAAFVTPDSGVDQDEVDLRYEIFLSRLKTLNDGEFHDFLRRDPERVEIAMQLVEAIAAAERYIRDLHEPRAVQRALALLAPLDRKLAALAAAANRFGAERVAQDQKELLRLHFAFTTVAAGLVACGTVFLVLLLRHNRLLEQARRELQSAAEELQIETDLVQTTLDTIDQGLIMFDPSGSVKILNRQALGLLDLHDELESTTRPASILSVHAKLSDFDQTIANFSISSLPSSGDTRLSQLTRKDGRVLEMRETRRQDNSIVRTFTDITERKSAELAKNTFLATMSHEIRTPLTGLLGMADLLAGEPLSDKESSYLNSIRTSGRHLLAVVNDVLDFTRIEAGVLEVERISFSVAALIENVRSLMAPQAVERGLDLKFEFATPPPAVKGDPTRLAQVLINLVGNGLKFTHRGGVIVCVSQVHEHESQVKLRFDVQDTGTGIAAEKQEELFQPFVQADHSMARRYGGSGLGLAISQRLIKAMGGEICFTSTLGTGSHFWFELSLDKGHPSYAQPSSFEFASVLPRRVLVAEDVELNRNLLGGMLSRYGHEVTFAVNGAEAAELAGREHFDVVLMDVQMPVMDGVEATRRIRTLPGHAGRVHIIGLTANVVASEHERYIAVGMNACVTKPIDWDQLFRAFGGTHEQVYASEAANKKPVLNQNTIGQLKTQFGEEEFQTFLTNAVRDAEQAIVQLEKVSGDPSELVREAHRLKGTSGLFGLERISALAGEVEATARSGDDIPPLIGRLRQALSATRAELDSALDSPHNRETSASGHRLYVA